MQVIDCQPPLSAKVVDGFEKLVITSLKPEPVITCLLVKAIPNCLDQQTAKGRFSIRIKLRPAHLFTTHGGGLTLSSLLLVKAIPNCLDQQTAKGCFSIRIKLRPAHLFTTHGGGLTLSSLLLNVIAKKL